MSAYQKPSQKSPFWDSLYIGSKLVKEVFQGQVAWEEGRSRDIRPLIGYPKAKNCFAWYFTDEKGEKQYTTILGIPPIDSPEMAVKAAIAGKARTIQKH